MPIMDAEQRQLTKKTPWIVRVWHFYVEGFRQMTIGRKLWAIIIIKLIIIFFVLKIFFLPNILQRDYSTDEQRANAVRTHLTN